MKDVVLAILGASSAMAGFVLVFLGIVITSFQSFSGTVPPQVTRPYRVLAVILYTTFCIALGAVAVCVGFLIGGGTNDVYRLAIGLFLVELLAMIGAGFWSLTMVFDWPRWR